MADLDIVNARRPQQFRRIDRQTDEDNDEEVRKRYRFTPHNIDRLERLIGHRLERPTRRNQPLTPRQQIMIALRFYATGNFLQVIGDTFGVDVATVSRVVTAVTDCIFDMKDSAIQFPTTDRHRHRTKTGFHAIRGFPSVISAVDGTHVRIQTPSDDEEQCVNRKHFHSINVQASCDHRGVFTSINAIWPGSTHDAHVFRTSELFHFMETHHHGLEDGILLGDSAYPCKPYMLTPYLHPANEAQQHFNDAHCSTRNVIERAFGVLKRRFHILHTEIRMKPLKVSKIVVCCVVLHNLAKLWGEPEEFPPEDDQQPPTVLNHDDDMSGKAVREYITMQYFS
ncbi:putative nuclease HARBI1 [Mya arenaria]|uniref:putative nuclease HARBI1 n=1 Tax=Mya arenaria TaxID=6604 RepID=UPI0022E5FB51|nr:putative nuclease HARBI1 [Mya arenaria]XP_052806961.1 putative nuclease HARBI1 [Mya arenaria]